MVRVGGLLSGDRRIYAVDLIGDAGHSIAGDRPIAAPDDLLAWIDTVLDGLGVQRAEVCGHSYGGWFALACALRRPDRVEKVTLLDPTMCFAPLPGYVIRAIPTLLRPTSARRSSLIRWETRRRPSIRSGCG